MREMAATMVETQETPSDLSVCPGQTGFLPVELGGFEPPTFSKGFIPLRRAERLNVRSFARLH